MAATANTRRPLLSAAKSSKSAKKATAPTSTREAPVKKRAPTKWNRATGSQTPERTESLFPFRIATTILAEIDETLQKLGYKSRTEFVRQALADQFEREGESELAAKVRTKVRS